MLVELSKMGGLRQCRNHLCRQFFTPSPRFPKAKYCVSCEIDRQIAEREKKFLKARESKSGAIKRRNERRARRKLRKLTVLAYPSAGFAAVRKQMASVEHQCGVSGMTSQRHKKFFGKDLHLDHTIPARIAKQNGVDPHDQRNLMWLSNSIHAQKKEAEEQLKGKGGIYGFVQVLMRNNWPREKLIDALKYCKIYSENLPF
jgi:hypothetical protein